VEKFFIYKQGIEALLEKFDVCFEAKQNFLAKPTSAILHKYVLL